MTLFQICLIKGLLIASVGIFLIPLIYWGIRFLIRRNSGKKHIRSGISLVLRISFVLLLAVWCLRFAVGYYGVYHPAEGEIPLSVGEEIGNSTVHALQSFTLDEDYTDYITRGREMLADPEVNAPEAAAGWQLFYSIYASLLNIAAPIAGGTILFEILSGIFPRIRLFFACINRFRKKYFFSELNPGSLALAESILEKAPKTLFRPAVLFTDAYKDEESEKRTELFLRAKSLGAICIRDDLAHFVTKRIRGAEYFLIDEREIENIKAFAALAAGERCKHLRGAVIRIFYQNDSYLLTEREIMQQLRARFRGEVEEKNAPDSRRFRKRKMLLKAQLKEGAPPITDAAVYESLTDDAAPPVLRVRPYQTLIYDLLRKTPLYTPIADRADVRELNVAILGAGEIGTEMFLSASWCGQLLGIPLGLNVVSLESETDFTARIDRLNPEILKSAEPGADLLAIYADRSAYSDPYFTFRYRSADLTLQEPDDILCGRENGGTPELRLTDADYFLVALGSDEANITAAERLRRAIAVAGMTGAGQKPKTVVCVVYDPALCETVNAHGLTAGGAVTMRAISGLSDLYSYENIILSARSDGANAEDANYRKTAAKTRKQLAQESNERSSKAYDYWSSAAKDFHADYKAFSAYHRTRTKKSPTFAEWYAENGKSWCTAPDDLYYRIGWLEHRRWNAYMRSQGFRLSPGYAPKNILLRLHPCLVECSCPMVLTGGHDLLDDVCAKLGTEYKQYDLPVITPIPKEK